MSRHRDIRNMDYSDEYHGYDDVYGHSVEDDYCISPSNRPFLYNRELSTRSSEDDIKEEDEGVDSNLSELDRTKLESCLDVVKEKLGEITLTNTSLSTIAVAQQFDPEKTIKAILENPSLKQAQVPMDKDVTRRKPFVIPKIQMNGLKSVPENKKFAVPNLFNKNSQENENIHINFGKVENSNLQNNSDISNVFSLNPVGNTEKYDIKKSFNIPNIFTKISNKNDDNINQFKMSSQETSGRKVEEISSNSDHFISLSEVVSNHLESQLQDLSNQMMDINLGHKEISSKLEISLSKECTFDLSHLLTSFTKHQKAKSKFGKVLCRKYRRTLMKVEKSNTLPKSFFGFNTPSPDDFLRHYLKR